MVSEIENAPVEGQPTIGQLFGTLFDSSTLINSKLRCQDDSISMLGQAYKKLSDEHVQLSVELTKTTANMKDLIIITGRCMSMTRTGIILLTILEVALLYTTYLLYRFKTGGL